jgi:hypothetical protein
MPMTVSLDLSRREGRRISRYSSPVERGQDEAHHHIVKLAKPSWLDSEPVCASWGRSVKRP